MPAERSRTVLKKTLLVIAGVVLATVLVFAIPRCGVPDPDRPWTSVAP